MKKINSAAPQSLHIPSGYFNANASEHYPSLPMTVSFFRNILEDGWTLNLDWGTFLTLLSVHNGVELQGVDDPHGFCAWPNTKSMAKTNTSSLLVIDYPEKFDIFKLAPQFNDIERASYVTYDPETGSEIFRVLFPLLRPISPEKFLALAPAIEKWADGDGSHPASDPVCYRIGRFCKLPSYRKDDTGLRVECVSPGWMLDECALDELMNTGVLTLA